MEYLKCDGWGIEFTGLPEKKETSLPTLLAIGNGTIGMRGTVPELEEFDRKGTFAAGFFDRLPRPELHYNTFTPFLKSWSMEEKVEQYHLEEALVNCPDVLYGFFEYEGEKFRFDRSNKQKLCRYLDMRTGEAVFRVPVIAASGKRAVLIRQRLASMKREYMVYEKCTLESINFEGKVGYRALTDTDTDNFNISGIYQDAAAEKDYAYYRLYDVLDKDDTDFYAVIRGRCNGYKLYTAGGGSFAQMPERIAPGEKISFERRAVLLCDRLQYVDRKITLECLKEGEAVSYEQAKEENKDLWQKIWQKCDIEIEGVPETQTSIRHNLYLLNISCCRISDRVSIAAKGLTGEGYRGMVFWDTDIHMLPFFLYTQPELARNMVSFRYRTLEGARKKAAGYGYQGAAYPWETGISGYEECESFLKLITHQLHITADVAWAAGKYMEAVGEEKFYVEQAAEIFLETARFWISRGYFENGKMGIRKASGPDELHLDSDNNAYLMNMVQWNLNLAWEAIGTLKKDYPEQWMKLKEKTGISEEEVEKIRKYKDCVRTMKGENGLYEQCEGFFNLTDEIVFENDPRRVPADTQTVKQADVIMLLYLLPYLVNKEELMENWNYYEPRTTHTSSLSYGVHGIIAAKLGLKEKAGYYLKKSMELDLMNPVSNCADGAHLAAAGMSWSAIVNGIAGIAFEKGGIAIAPALPENWAALKIPLVYHGNRIKISLVGKNVQIENSKSSGSSVNVFYKGKHYQVERGDMVCL